MCTRYTSRGRIGTAAPFPTAAGSHSLPDVSAADVMLLPAPARTAELHARMLPQKDNFCGAFCGAIALCANDIDVDQDDVAVASGSLLPEVDGLGGLPPGASPRLDYRLSVPRVADDAITGTSARGLAHAVEELSGGAVEAVGLPAPLTADQVCRVLTDAGEAGAFAIANLRTEPLWASRPSPAALVAYLEHGEDVGEPAEWSVGHFCELAGILRGSAGTLIVLRDTYAQLGLGGHHLQPAERVAEALEGRGILLVGPRGAVPRPDDCTVGLWDNGTPYAAREV